MGEFIVNIETIDGKDSLNITAESVLEMYEEVIQSDGFVRILDYTEDE